MFQFPMGNSSYWASCPWCKFQFPMGNSFGLPILNLVMVTLKRFNSLWEIHSVCSCKAKIGLPTRLFQFPMGNSFNVPDNFSLLPPVSIPYGKFIQGVPIESKMDRFNSLWEIHSR